MRISTERKPFILALTLALTLLSSCAHKPPQSAVEAMRLVEAPELTDDLELEPLFAAIELELRFFESRPGPETFVFGPKTLTKPQYLAGLRRFVELGRGTLERAAFFEAVKKEFDFYEVKGQTGWGEAFVTSYFEPVIAASRKRTARHSRPIYKIPDDMLALDLAGFDEKYKDERKLRARVADGRKLVPYYTREEIDVGGKLAGKKLELAWLDPLDAFVLQIQGSGTLDFGDGRKKLRVGYAEKNGQRYESIGKFLRDRLPPDQITMHTIEEYLRGLPPADMQAVLNHNPSYVFFSELKPPLPGVEAAALTYLGLPAVAGRTMATDKNFFPKGALAFLISTKPEFDSPSSTVPKSWTPFSRFTLDQDIGGAIVGGGRVDLFWGTGDPAKQAAGVIKHPGRLYYLVPRVF